MKNRDNSIFFQLRRFEALLLIFVAVTFGVHSQSVVSFPKDRAASVAVVVRDLSTGKDVVSQNPDKAMLPASTMKCVTAAAAMEDGLDSSTFDSRAFIRGEVDANGVLHGNLVIRGNGDPTMESAQFPSVPSFLNEIVKGVKAHGIKRIEGGIVVDASNFPDDGPCDRWELSDLRYEYGAGLYSLNFRDNRRGDKSMEAPGEVFCETLENRLLANGIAVDWQDLPAAKSPLKEIAQHKSIIGAEILRNMMVRSDNLFAEGMLRRLAPGQKRDAAIAKERQLLAKKGINLDITDIYDGSGLSRNNRVTANFMADLLQKMAQKQGAHMSYVQLFPLVGKEGTVKSLLQKTPLEGRLALKSGSMNGVHCYAGYKLDNQGKPTHAVVIMVNDFFCSRDAVRSSIESFLKKTF